ncbi:hypothetical protein Micbo1qcDRAFT_122504 [Microdochium bolleyi]|uniref:F-box domain-containing protein n=1 Tax=Microdochium bolleyi TaxID=196109 RepID=A0A136IWD8_9PEZI|nr:hypothetical protein Micbo1qcDRAFT_122504 [Microdochium bolleyi]
MPRRPEYGAWQRPMPIKQTRKRREPGELFRVLPTEVLQLILMELKKSHLRPGSDSCATCMMRDLFSVALTCRRLSKAAHNVLYEDIQIVGADSAAHKKRFKTTAGSRLVLLRRTLRANPELAALVRTLKVPAVPNDLPADKYQDRVASVIMACPNFERLLGFHQPYDHSFSRLFHALSTRENLREMNWFLESAVTEQRQGRSRSQSSSTATPVNSEMGVDIERTTAFFDLHMNWSHLTTLSIYCSPGAVLDGISMFGMTLANMPALQSLHLADLPTTVFNDATLLSLPPLQSLSLCNLQGVSSTGLAAFARRPSSHGIRKLTLRHLGIDSVPALGRLFSNLTALESFTFVQSHAPELPKDEVIWLYPYLASSSLQKLHWDVPTRGSGASEADRILAKSIAFQGYPALRSLRTPNDPDGVFQALCAPLERVEIASDKYRGLIARIPDRIRAPEPSPPMTPVSPSSPFGFGKQSSGMKFTNDPPTPVEPPAPVESHLAQSRLAAQARIEAAKSTPRFQVNVIDEDGTIVDRFGLAGFIGQVESRIRYNIRPDPGATDENGGLTHITDLLKDGGEELKDREGCTGRWLSWSEGITNDKKERERWWHTERGRWRELEMS